MKRKMKTEALEGNLKKKVFKKFYFKMFFQNSFVFNSTGKD